jgi:hypothetical protein
MLGGIFLVVKNKRKTQVTEQQQLNTGEMAAYLVEKNPTPEQAKKAIALLEENINATFERRQDTMNEYKTMSTDTLVQALKSKLSIIQNTQLKSFPNECVKAWVIIEQACPHTNPGSISIIIDTLCSRGVFTRRKDVEPDAAPYQVYVSQSADIATELEGAERLVLMISTLYS